MDTFIYQYSVGGFIFLVGLGYAFKQGYVGFSGRPLRSLLILMAGLGVLMAIQGYLQYGSMSELPAQTYEGPPLERGIIGEPIDYAIMIGYFVMILIVGTYFGRNQKSTKDFFFAGQRFSWWLISLSLVATTVGSYSFVKYSKVAYDYGLSSSQTYLNDWFWVPLFLFGWLPILYFSRITSIPEYFERRFGRTARGIATFLLLVYLVGYVGVNLFTMGKALNALLGWEIWVAAFIVAAISATYVTFGGQTSVIMTDLLQGVMLLVTGAVLLWLGIDYLGDHGGLWENLPRSHRLAFANFNEDPAFPGVGIFWQDAVANTAMFYFLNQGILMRFMAAKSVNEGRKAALFVPVILMPVAAIAVASGGWVGRGLVNAGLLPEMASDEVFYYTAEFLAQPGVFGLIMAALTAALMSTVDTLVTAVSAIVVNDVYKPYIRPSATERQLLRVARISALSVMAFGLLLVPVFMMFDSIYEAHASFTAAVTPPLVVALLCSVFWRRYTNAAAIATMVGGSLFIFLSVLHPEIIGFFSHGVPAREVGDGLFAGAKQFKFTRAFFGLSVSAAFAVSVTLFTRPESKDRQRGLVWGTIADALTRYKGSPGKEVIGKIELAKVEKGAQESFEGEANLPVVAISQALADELGAEPGSLLYVADSRRYLGGLRSCHVLLGEVDSSLSDLSIRLGPVAYDSAIAPGRADKKVRVELLY